MKPRVDRIINLLVDEIEERMRERHPPSPPEPPVEAQPLPAAAPVAAQEAPEAEVASEQGTALLSVTPAPVCPVCGGALREGSASCDVCGFETEREQELPPVSTLSPHAARLMGRLALGLLVAIVLINIPWRGRTLATAMPDSDSLIIRNGLVVKEESDERIYVYQDGRFRWISSLDAFEHYGFTWRDVHIVEDGYLDRYEKGADIHVLLKCRDSPHIYRLEEGLKRWIRDIDTFVAEEHVWEDVRFVSCQYLRDLPDGETIPSGSGPPPQP